VQHHFFSSLIGPSGRIPCKPGRGPGAECGEVWMKTGKRQIGELTHILLPFP